jgi:hypothetical protein
MVLALGYGPAIDGAVIRKCKDGFDGARDLVSARKVQAARGADARRLLRDVLIADEQGRGGIWPLDFIDQRVHPVPLKTCLDVLTDAPDERTVRHMEDLYPDLG